MVQNKMTFTLLSKPEEGNHVVPIMTPFTSSLEKSVLEVERERTQVKHMSSVLCEDFM